MKLGLYAIASLILIALIGAFIYTLDLKNYHLDIISLTLPVAVWVMMPLILLYMFTLAHFFYYGSKNYFQFKKWYKDTDTLEDALYRALVNEPKAKKYVINEMKSCAVLLSKASLTLSDNVEGLSPKLGKVANVIRKINAGEYVDLKEEKLAKVFKVGNPILVQNRLNRLSSDEDFVESVLKSSSDYSVAVQKEALSIFSSKANFEQARKYSKLFDIENLLVMINRITNEDNLGLNKDILSSFIDDLKLSCTDFIKIAEVTKKYLKPDENLAIFNSYQKKNEKAQNAYLYLLFEYELMDQVATFLEEHEEKDFVKFRAFYKLKESKCGYKLEDIIDIYSVCNKINFL